MSKAAIYHRFKCPHPECEHIGELITKAHCRMAHDMERDALFKKYGKPVRLEFNGEAVAQNRKMKTILYNSPYAGFYRQK